MNSFSEKVSYPDGQVSIKVKSFPQEFTFKIQSYEDLFVLRSICDVYRFKQIPIVSVTIPCMFGQRSDRRFDPSQSFDLKNICDFINTMGIGSVKIFDSHSDVCLGMINNSEKLTALPYVKLAIDDIQFETTQDLVLVSPDAGAYKKLFSMSESFSLPLVAANKFRSKDGEVTLNIAGDVRGKKCLIVDDILDGGYTFHLLSEQLKQQGAEKVYLYVSHGYFNKGFDFTPYIDHFFCTDSVKEISHKKVTQFKL